MNWNGKVTLVIGCGISGIAAAQLLEEKGALPVLFDENEKVDIGKIKDKLGKTSSVKIILGKLPREIIEKLQLTVVSPGVPMDNSVVLQLKEENIPIIGEVELAYLCGKGEVLAITGTNGKTTTTALCGKIVSEYYSSAFTVGNIGIPYTKMAVKMEEDSVTVAEISSFQLETIEDFHPRISAVLNITPDHLDRHHTMENYVMAKARIMKNQTHKDYCILNYEDPYRKMLEKECKANRVYFSSKRVLENGYYLKGEEIKYAKEGKEEHLLGIHEMNLLGIHNVENVMAAIAITESYGINREHILKVIRNFTAVEHRIEYVDTIKGVEYYNDSKGTNPDAAIKAVEAMRRPTLLIGGGYDKNSTYDEWIKTFPGKVKTLVLLGQTKEKIAACAKAQGFSSVVMTDSLEEAVWECYCRAKEGDAVLLSPACASWGMFPNYEVRGNQFKELVKKLKEK